jgi:hypothetical protein
MASHVEIAALGNVISVPGQAAVNEQEAIVDNS